MRITETRAKQEWLLSTKERKYLCGENVKNEDKRDRNIRNTRTPNICKRIQALIDDIALMKKGGYIGADKNTIDIEDIRIEPRFDLIDRNIKTPCYLQPRPPSLSLGLSLGYVTQSLTSSMIPFNSFLNIWGYIVGLIKNNNETNFQIEVRNLIKFLEEHLQQKPVNYDYDPLSKQEIIKAIVDPRKKVERLEFPIQLQLHYLEHGVKDQLQDRDHSILDTIEISFEQSRKYISFKSLLKSHSLNTTKLVWNNISGNDLFNIIWADGELTSQKLKKKYNNKKKTKITDKGTVSKIMADLAGQDRDQRYRDSSHKWNKRPLVQEIAENTRRGRVWEITSYGYVAGHWAFENKKEVKRNIGELAITGNPTNPLQEKIKDSVEFIDEELLDYTRD